MASSRILRTIVVTLILLCPLAVRLVSGEHQSSASAAPILSAVTMSGTITGGGTVTIKVALSDKATSATAVSLKSNRPSVLTPPSTVMVPIGEKYASVQVLTRAANQTALVTITAKLGAVTKTTQVTVKPPALSSVSLPDWVAEGGRVYLTVRLNSVAPRGGMDVAIAARPAGKFSLMPTSVHVPGGTTGLAVALRAAQVSAPISVTVQGTLNGISKSDSIVITDSAQVTVTATRTKTPVPPAATATKTPIPPAATATKTPIPPTATATKTPIPPTATTVPQITGVDLTCSPSILHPGDYSTCTVTLLGVNLGALPQQPVSVLIGRQPVYLDAPDSINLSAPTFVSQFQVRALAIGTPNIFVHVGEFSGGFEDTFDFVVTAPPTPAVTGITLSCPDIVQVNVLSTCTVYIQGVNLIGLPDRDLEVQISSAGSPLTHPLTVKVTSPFESKSFTFTPATSGTATITVQYRTFSDSEDIVITP